MSVIAKHGQVGRGAWGRISTSPPLRKKEGRQETETEYDDEDDEDEDDDDDHDDDLLFVVVHKGWCRQLRTHTWLVTIRQQGFRY